MSFCSASMSGTVCSRCHSWLGRDKVQSRGNGLRSKPRFVSAASDGIVRLNGGLCLGPRFVSYRSGRGHVACAASEGSSSALTLSNEEAVVGVGELLAGDPEAAAQLARVLVTNIDKQGRAILLSALFASAPDAEADEHFKEADTNSDGVVDRIEFANFVEAQAVKYGTSKKPLTTDQLVQLGVRAGVGMIGFGFTDNAIMIIAGDAIQNSIGVGLGLSTLMSAGLGNAIADLVGTAFRGYIEMVSSHFMPEIKVSSVQMQSKEAWWADTVGSTIGVTLGCLLGLLPLLYIAKHEDGPAGGENIPSQAIVAQTDPASSDISYCVQTQRQEVGGPSDGGRSAPSSSRGSGTLFASVSGACASPCLTRKPDTMPGKLGGLILILTVSSLMVVRRAVQFGLARRKSAPLR